jgi:hypothetical protein
MTKIWQARKSIVRNIASCFSHHLKGHLMSSTSNWYCLKINNFFLTSFLLDRLYLFVKKYPNYNPNKKYFG